MQATNNKPKRIYIAGRVTGDEWSATVAKFAAAEAIVTANGCSAVNPVTISSEDIPWKTAMRRCIEELMQCDAIYMLPCWPRSRGAILERFIAGSVGIEIIDAPKF